MKVQLASQVTGHVNDKPPLKHQPLDVGAAKAWLDHIPNHAELHAIMWDRGNQRDPQPFLHGLQAIWEEER